MPGGSGGLRALGLLNADTCRPLHSTVNRTMSSVLRHPGCPT